MASLIPQTSKKSADPQTEKVLRARAGMASFANSIASQASVKAEAAPARKAFISTLDGHTDAPQVQTVTKAQKSDALASLPVSARKTAERFDADTQAFINVVYARHAETGDAIDFTFAEAATVMRCDEESARRRVEALTSIGLLKPAYSPMGSLKGYLPTITN
ncbi:hypothetical protein [Shinella zoogloeoides]|uniref:Uncharacterized protein n=1 Tax=Shinella zoogloeoides TaxID=352475 RepID=A0A6N8TGM2_SHIZO|nr:hypothetical protein [Shinella zoogloeoides]MXO01336.1 hypothetical protein [Shinella zoogloeoides]UEX81567.1 hypothetical protein K8M09_18725 [Shinella zoogloeoides]